MNDKQAILAKIKKCMALSSSSNEHEAAAALRQAQKLMQQHNLNMVDIENSDIIEASTKSSANVRPSNWETQLVWHVSNAFECVWYFVPYKGYVFVGYGTNSEIAAYVFEVLIRQAKKSRKDFISKLGRTTRAKKTKSADFFMEGWIHSVYELIKKTYSIDTKTHQKLNQYIDDICQGSEPLKTQDRTSDPSQADFQAFHMGKDDGEKVRLNQAVAGTPAERLNIGVIN